MQQLIAIVAYAIVWISCGFLMAMYFKQYLCEARQYCAECKSVERRWHKFAWLMDIGFALLAVPFLILLFK